MKLKWLIALLCMSDLACRDDVMSNYREPAKVANVTAEFPEIRFPSGFASGTPPFTIPANRPLTINGRISGISVIGDVTFGVIHLHPKGNRRMTIATAFMELNRIDENAIAYEAVFEPIRWQGEAEFHIQLNMEQPICVPARIVSDSTLQNRR